MAAHCMTFFMDYFETSALLFSFCLYELSYKPDIQKQLRQDIRSVANSIEDLNYDGLNKLSYLDMVISGKFTCSVNFLLFLNCFKLKLLFFLFLETLRLHPPLQTFTRICTYPTTLNARGKMIRVDEGIPVAIPVYSVHRDEKNFQEPLEFIPERFNENESKLRHKFTFLGWGEGPRICTGNNCSTSIMPFWVFSINAKYV